MSEEKNNKKRMYMPLMYPLWVLFTSIISLPVFLFVIFLSFESGLWEAALNETPSDRILSLLAVALAVWNIWLSVFTIKILIRVARENNL